MPQDSTNAGSSPGTEDKAKAIRQRSLQPKWWGQSLTIWGSIVTAVSTVAPVLGPLFGIDIGVDALKDLSDNVVRALQAVGGVVGTAMTIWGRLRASTRLVGRQFTLHL